MGLPWSEKENTRQLSRNLNSIQQQLRGLLRSLMMLWCWITWKDLARTTEHNGANIGLQLLRTLITQLVQYDLEKCYKMLWIHARHTKLCWMRSWWVASNWKRAFDLDSFVSPFEWAQLTQRMKADRSQRTLLKKEGWELVIMDAD